MEFHVYKVGNRRLLSVMPPDAVTAGLPSEGVVGELTGQDGNITPDTFVPNQAFAAFLQWVILRHGPAHPALVQEAQRQRDGTVLVVDRRTAGSTPANMPARDVLGRFEVKDGALQAYALNPEHLLCSEDGLLDVDEHFQERLLLELRALGG
jgi:hypothetical protein